MKLAPLFNSAGQLLGHIDLSRCRRDRDSYTVDEHAGSVMSVWHKVTGDTVKDTIRFYRFPFKRIRFRWGAEGELTLRYLVVDEPIPEWVWVAAGIKFNGIKDWERQ